MTTNDSTRVLIDRARGVLPADGGVLSVGEVLVADLADALELSLAPVPEDGGREALAQALSSQRLLAAQLIHAAECGCGDYEPSHSDDQTYGEQADAILAAGFRRVSAPVATVEDVANVLRHEAGGNLGLIMSTGEADFLAESLLARFDIRPRNQEAQ